MSKNNIEAIYPLSPMQEGILFHSLYQTDFDIYIGQLSYSLYGDLNVSAFERAWRKVTERHPVLRTLFVWEQNEKPLQIVRPAVNFRIEEQDWRGLDGESQQRRLDSYLKTDREAGFNLSKAPLMRGSLIRLDDRRYEFVWTHHRLIVDGWSVALLMNEVFSYYKAYNRGEELELESARPYRDFIVWLEKQDKAKAEIYWRKLLNGITAPTRLGMDRAGVSGERSGKDYGEERCAIGRETLGRLQEVARKHRLTMSTIMQGAWALLLSEYSGDKDVVFGVTVSGRPAEIEGVERMMGTFINTLPMRVKIEGKKSVVEWLKEIQQEQAESREYQYSPLVEIQGWSDAPRGAPLFESILAYENYPVGKESSSGGHEDKQPKIRVERVLSFEQSNYPLALMASAEGELLIKILYDRQRIKAEAIGRAISHLKRLLESLAANPTGPVSELEILSDAERRQLLIAWNNTKVDYESNCSIQELFERNAEARPDATAVVCKGDRLSYGEMNRRANRLAYSLRTNGVGPEKLVGVLMDRGIDLVVGLLGILKSGGAYVPIDPAYPEHRIRQMIEDANLNNILTQRHLAEKLSEQNVNIICVDANWMETEQVSEENPPIQTLADNLAYVNYTSGSTGKPKGVGVSHKNVLRLVRGAKYARMDVEQVFLHFAPICFDAATFEIWGCLLNGGKLAIVPSDASSLDDVGEETRKHGVTVLWLTSGLFNLLIDERIEDLKSVKQLIAGGDILSTGHVSKAIRHLNETELINGYGPTESTTFTCCYKIESEDQIHGGVPIGRPISNTQAYLLNDCLKPAPIGISGELYIGGDGLSRGYLNRPDLTAERFVPDPFGREPGARLYRTGDIARYREDGVIEFIGRRDHQVKVRGYRIELGEIETAIREQEEIKDAVVMASGDVADKRLVGYVVWKEGSRLSWSELRERLRAKLPDYMAPGEMVELDELPLTSNGKIDRKRLPEPVKLSEEGSLKERSPLQELLAGIWADVLGAQKVGPYDNFFDLGGQSLLASRLVSRIRKKLKVSLPLRHIFEFPTIAELAEQIQLEMGLLSETDLTPIRRAPRTGDLPLSFAQQRLWFLDQLHPANPAYNINQALRLSGSLDLLALEGAFSDLLARHETLRSSFPLKNGQPVQLISPPQPVRLEVEDLSHLDPHLREQEAQRRLKLEAVRGFDLQRGPVFRVGLMRLSQSDHILRIGMHHIISDAWSVGVMMDEIARLYEGRIRGERAELRELEVQYVDYAVWQREKMRGEELERELGHWKKELEGASQALEIGVRRREDGIGSRGAIQRELIGEWLSEEVKRLSREEGVTLFMTLFAAFNLVLSYRSGREDILVGVDVADRNRAELEGLIGLLVNQLVLRANLSGDPTFLQLLERVRDVTLRAYAHQDLPFDKLVDALNPARGSNRNPLFQVMFGLQNLPKTIWRLPGIDLTPLALETDTAIFDLSLYMADSQNGLTGVIRYNTDLFDSETVTRIFKQMESVLLCVVERPEIRISQLRALLAEQDKQEQAVKQANFTQEALRKLKGIKPRPVSAQ